ncbi:MAG: hypothetical protein ACREBS_06060 [Nitrososphaerales archaeon]
MTDNTDTANKELAPTPSAFRCEICNNEFPTKLGYNGHKAG